MGNRRGGDTTSGKQSNVQNFAHWTGQKTREIVAEKAGCGLGEAVCLVFDQFAIVAN